MDACLPPAESAWATEGDVKVTIGGTSKTAAPGSGAATDLGFVSELVYDGSETGVSGLKVEVEGSSPSYTEIKAGKQNSGTAYYTVEATDGLVGTYTITLYDNNDDSVSLTDGEQVSYEVVANTTVDDLWSEGSATFSTNPDAAGKFYFNETGSAIDLRVTGLKDYQYKTVDESDYKTVWYDVDNDEVLSSAPKAAGNYQLQIWPAGELADGVFAAVSTPLSYDVAIVAKDTTVDYSLYQPVNGDETDVSDTMFVYNGSNFLAYSNVDEQPKCLTNLKLSVDGVPTDLQIVLRDNATAGYTGSSDNGLESGDYFVKYIGNSSTLATVSNASIGTAQNVADSTKLYIAKYESGLPSAAPVVAVLDLNILPFDYSKAAISVDGKELSTNGSESGTSIKFTYGGEEENVAFDVAGTSTEGLKLTVDSFEPAVNSGAPAGYKGLFGYKGLYTVSVDRANSTVLNTGNYVFTGEALTTDLTVATNQASDFEYGTEDVTAFTQAAPKKFDLSKGESFDAKKINWDVNGSTDIAYNGKNATVKLYNAEGEEVSSADAAGTYRVNVTVTPDAAYTFAGSTDFYIKVVGGEADSVVATVGGKVAQVAPAVNEVSYTGSEILTSVVVRDTENEKVFAEGTDYAVEIRDLDANKVVDSIVDPGNYTITVTGKNCMVGTSNKAVYNVTVLPAIFKGVEVEEQTFGYDTTEYDVASINSTNTVAQDRGIAYTGSAVAPVVKAYVEKVVDGKTVKAYTELDPSMYAATYSAVRVAGLDAGDVVKAENLKNVGEYSIQIVTTDEFAAKFGEGAAIATDTDSFEIVDTIDGGFSDVKASEWYADEATKAKQLGYMTGLSDTNMLMPTANITRADVCMVLMRMAVGDPDMKPLESHPTKFGDVDAYAYYAKAIDWAYKAGIVSGYDGTENFGPNDLVTREQMAKMIALFAQNVQGEDITGGTLEGYVDADQLTFGKDYMAWCVENGVFGVNTDVLDPAGNAQRAQVAAISVRLCPAEEL